MIERAYGHLARGPEEFARARLDAYLEQELERLGVERASGTGDTLTASPPQSL